MAQVLHAGHKGCGQPRAYHLSWSTGGKHSSKERASTGTGFQERSTCSCRASFLARADGVGWVSPLVCLFVCNIRDRERGILQHLWKPLQTPHQQDFARRLICPQRTIIQAWDMVGAALTHPLQEQLSLHVCTSGERKLVGKHLETSEGAN